MTIINRGSALPPSPHRSADTLYVDDRSLTTLERLGVAADVVTIARRGDQILDPTGSIGSERVGADGRVTLSELDRLDEPANNAALFPEERAALRRAHALFAIPETTAPVAVEPLANLEYRLERRLVSPAVTSVVIDDLPAELRRSGQRLQLVRDSDTTPATVTRADVEWARANPGAFTAETLRDFETIASRFHDDVFDERVIGILPEPLQRRAVLDADGVRVELASRVGFHTGGAGSSRPEYSWAPALHSTELHVTAPPGMSVLVKATSTTAGRVGFFEEVATGSGAPQRLDNFNLGAGVTNYWIQVVNAAGEVVSNRRLDVPAPRLPPMTVAPELAGRRVQEWRTADGTVVDHHATPEGIPGYSLDGHPHLFARDMIYTSLPVRR